MPKEPETNEKKVADIKAEELRRGAGQTTPNETEEQSSLGAVCFGNFSDLIRKHDEELEKLVQTHYKLLGVNNAELEQFKQKFTPRFNSANKADNERPNTATSNNDISTPETQEEQKPDPRWARAFLDQRTEEKRQVFFTEEPEVTTKLNDLTRSLSEEMRKDKDNFQDLKPDDKGNITIETWSENLVLKRDDNGRIAPPLELKAGQGPLTLSFAHVRSKDKQNMSEESAVYDLFHYDENGNLVDIITPQGKIQDHDGVECHSKVSNLSELRKQLLQNRESELGARGDNLGQDGVFLSDRGGAGQQAVKIEEGVSAAESRESFNKQNAAAIQRGSKDDGSGTKDPSKIGTTIRRKYREAEDITIGSGGQGSDGIQGARPQGAAAKIEKEVVAAESTEDLTNNPDFLAEKFVKGVIQSAISNVEAIAKQKSLGGSDKVTQAVKSETTVESRNAAATGPAVDKQRVEISDEIAGDQPQAPSSSPGTKEGRAGNESNTPPSPPPTTAESDNTQNGLTDTTAVLPPLPPTQEEEATVTRGSQVVTGEVVEQDVISKVVAPSRGRRGLASRLSIQTDSEALESFTTTSQASESVERNARAATGPDVVRQSVEMTDETVKTPNAAEDITLGSGAQGSDGIQGARPRGANVQGGISAIESIANLTKQNPSGSSVKTSQGVISEDEIEGLAKQKPLGSSANASQEVTSNITTKRTPSKSKKPNLASAKVVEDLLYSIIEEDLNSLNLSDEQKNKLESLKVIAAIYNKDPQNRKALSGFLDITQEIVEEMNKIPGLSRLARSLENIVIEGEPYKDSSAESEIVERKAHAPTGPDVDKQQVVISTVGEGLDSSQVFTEGLAGKPVDPYQDPFPGAVNVGNGPDVVRQSVEMTEETVKTPNAAEDVIPGSGDQVSNATALSRGRGAAASVKGGPIISEEGNSGEDDSEEGKKKQREKQKVRRGKGAPQQFQFKSLDEQNEGELEKPRADARAADVFTRISADRSEGGDFEALLSDTSPPSPSEKKKTPVVVPPLDFSFLNQTVKKKGKEDSHKVWEEQKGVGNAVIHPEQGGDGQHPNKGAIEQINDASPSQDLLFQKGKGVGDKKPKQPTGVVQEDISVRYGEKPNLDKSSGAAKVYPVDDSELTAPMRPGKQNLFSAQRAGSTGPLRPITQPQEKGVKHRERIDSAGAQLLSGGLGGSGGFTDIPTTSEVGKATSKQQMPTAKNLRGGGVSPELIERMDQWEKKSQEDSKDKLAAEAEARQNSKKHKRIGEGSNVAALLASQPRTDRAAEDEQHRKEASNRGEAAKEEHYRKRLDENVKKVGVGRTRNDDENPLQNNSRIKSTSQLSVKKEVKKKTSRVNQRVLQDTRIYTAAETTEAEKQLKSSYSQERKAQSAALVKVVQKSERREQDLAQARERAEANKDNNNAWEQSDSVIRRSGVAHEDPTLTANPKRFVSGKEKIQDDGISDSVGNNNVVDTVRSYSGSSTTKISPPKTPPGDNQGKNNGRSFP